MGKKGMAGGSAAIPFSFRLQSADGLDLHEVPHAVSGVGGLDEGGVADGVADLVKLDQAGHALVADAGH